MPRKKFLEDFEYARSHPAANIHDLCKGDDDGQIHFLWTGAQTPKPVKVYAMVPDLGEYPNSHEYMVYADDDAPAAAAQLLQRLPSTRRKSLSDLLSAVSSISSTASDTDSDDEMLSEDDDMDVDDYDHGLNLGSSQAAADQRAQFSSRGIDPEIRTRLRSDIERLKSAGFRIGFYGSLLQRSSGMLSISTKFKKLGLSSEAMGAWSLQPDDYLVLLIKYSAGYKSLDQLLATDTVSKQSLVDLRVGLSQHYKPDNETAYLAFEKSREITSKDVLRSPSTFEDTFISRPLNEMINERLIPLLKLRHRGADWDLAEEGYCDILERGVAAEDLAKTKKRSGSYYGRPTDPNSDHFTASGLRSFPLIAMQFTLRHFLQCTDFCLVCHRKLKCDFEALKPYVCERPLCLYQYMSLGFGPRIEHEISTQPMVVDLLVSFCYSAATSGGLREFPIGLGLMVPASYASLVAQGNHTIVPAPGADRKGVIKLKLTSGHHEARAEVDATAVCPFRSGDWVILQDAESIKAPLHCRINETTYWPTVRYDDIIGSKVQEAANPTSKPPSGTAKKAFPQSTKAQYVFMQRYDVLFDELRSSEKQQAILALLDTLPDVREMKEYLATKAKDLSQWTTRISPSALGVLRWIIASNRSCIMQVDDLLDDQGVALTEERVFGMPGWLQFRFAMGAPDKERRFVKAVKSTSQRLQTAHSTIFAWHGSHIKNWHSIVRKGLHFETTVNGRAYGDGVYHSPHQTTSLGYCQNHRYTHESRDHWPSSLLRVNFAMSLNELVNAPHEYVSRNPHYVIAQLDWIQTRYLFVQAASGSDMLPKDDLRPKDAFPQDFHLTPLGEKSEKIVIPRAAISTTTQIGTPSKRKSVGFLTGLLAKKIKGTGARESPVELDDDDDDNSSDTTNEDDRRVFDDLEEPPIVISSPTLGAVIPPAPRTPCSFVPGQLDHSTLPQMSMPTYANPGTTARLMRDFRDLLKVQNIAHDNGTQAELGWYISEEQLDNVYAWIVELHSFDTFTHNSKPLPLAADMKKSGTNSIVLEVRFPASYPITPPWVRVIQPRFLGFQEGGGGHVTAGGAMCMELLTNSGWSAVSSMESVLLQIRLAMTSTDPHPARLDGRYFGDMKKSVYGLGEAVEAFRRAMRVHGWKVDGEFEGMISQRGEGL